MAATDPWDGLPADAYTLLGVARTADSAAIRAAWRAAARTHHPDRGGDPGAFAAAKTAHDILSNPGTRRRYDSHLAAASAPTRQAAAGPGPSSGTAGSTPAANKYSWAPAGPKGTGPAGGGARPAGRRRAAGPPAGGNRSQRRSGPGARRGAARASGRPAMAVDTGGRRTLYGLDTATLPGWLVARDTSRWRRAVLAAVWAGCLAGWLAAAHRIGVDPWSAHLPASPLNPGALPWLPAPYAGGAAMLAAAAASWLLWNTPVTVARTAVGAAGVVAVFYLVMAAWAGQWWWAAGAALLAAASAGGQWWLWRGYRARFRPPADGWAAG